jgi:hypothetical protein
VNSKRNGRDQPWRTVVAEREDAVLAVRRQASGSELMFPSPQIMKSVNGSRGTGR